jgi:hypothetical protein
MIYKEISLKIHFYKRHNKMIDSLRRFKIKLFNWEYWPIWVVYFPMIFYYIYLSIKSKSLFFFSASNPTIETGGMFFESKWKIYNLIPQEFFPITIFVDYEENVESILSKLKESNLNFPIIAKPDRGERGGAVKILRSENDLLDYRTKIKVTFLIQAYINYPLELSVFYARKPSENKGILTSVTLKKLLEVTGDGKSDLETLIRKNDRAFLQLEALKSKIDLTKVIPKDENIVLVPYGNHVRGAMFLDYNHIIDEELTDTFDKISKQIDGFYFGRYDLRCTSLEDLKAGKNIMILELNGSGAEPAHIYQPGYSFFKAQQSLALYYSLMYQISAENHKKGVPFMTRKEYFDLLKDEKIYKSKMEEL